MRKHPFDSMSPVHKNKKPPVFRRGPFEIDGDPLKVCAAAVFRGAYTNCLRNLRSFSKNILRSDMPYLSMATRSTPRPKAKPVYFSGS